MSNERLKELSENDLSKMQNELLIAQNLLRPRFQIASEHLSQSLKIHEKYPEGYEYPIDDIERLTRISTPYTSITQSLLVIEQIRLLRAGQNSDPQP